MQERALPDAGCAHDRDHFAALDAERQAAQHLQAPPRHRVALRQVGRHDEGHGRLFEAQRLRGIELRGLA
jgi:hypothetical protein